MNDANKINIEVIEEWVAGKGIHPVNWKTLTEVLHDIELSMLAEEIESQQGIYTLCSFLVLQFT